MQNKFKLPTSMNNFKTILQINIYSLLKNLGKKLMLTFILMHKTTGSHLDIAWTSVPPSIWPFKVPGGNGQNISISYCHQSQNFRNSST